MHPMLDRQSIVQQPDLVKAGIAKKRLSAPIDEIIAAYEQWRVVTTQLGEMNAKRNAVSKTIGALMAQGKKDEAETAKADAKEISDAIPEVEEKERILDSKLRELELSCPNMAHESVPEGASEEDNVVVRTRGEKQSFDFEPKAHWDLATALGILDFERAIKISGSGYAVYQGWGARLQRALFNYMIDLHTIHGEYLEVYPPYVVNTASLLGTGQLPKFEEDLYRVDDDHFLIPTAEVPVTNLYRDEILDVWQLPIKNAAFSGCFRKEAGAAGKDTRGIQRMHQFDKVELVKICLPENSYDELELLVTDAERVLQSLGLHYRVSLLCGPEMSFSNSKCFDLEVWAPGVGRYLEVSSCSNFEAFQARRANIRFRRAQGEKPEFAHVLNGSGVATPRLFIAILESYQQADGSIVIPEPLRPYVGTDRIEQ